MHLPLFPCDRAKSEDRRERENDRWIPDLLRRREQQQQRRQPKRKAVNADASVCLCVPARVPPTRIQLILLPTPLVRQAFLSFARHSLRRSFSLSLCCSRSASQASLLLPLSSS